MNIEEARKHLKKNLNNWKKSKKDNGYMPEIMEEINTNYESIETLLTAYEKEKETNKQIKCKLDEKNIPIETLLAEFERLEDLEDDLTTVYLNGVYDGEKKVQDKIKAIIEEYKKQIEKDRKEIKESVLRSVVISDKEERIQELQSLLEKE